MVTAAKDAPAPIDPSGTPPEARSTRRLLLAASSIYLAWWLVVEMVLPGSYNPAWSRLVVVAAFFASFAASFASRAATRHIGLMFSACVWLLTAHYYYLLHRNHGDMPWAVGAYILVIAAGACLPTRGLLLAYSGVTVLLAFLASLADPPLLHSIFLPGLVTMVLLSNLTLHSRLLLERERTEHGRASVARAAAETGIALRDEFISIASHEFRTPITALQVAVQGLARIARRTGAPPSLEALERSLDLCLRQTARLARLVDGLLDASQVTGGGLALRLERVSLLELVRDVAQSLATDAARSGSRVDIDGDPDVSGQWDRTRIEQVVSNLLRNAITFGLDRPIRVSVAADGKLARLAVADQGIGVPPEEQARIFGRFERAVSSENYGGMGLGLYVVSRIVEAHEGSIRVESTPGSGATFVVELPRAPS
jgi:signal transduction histidine kinase